MSCVDTYECYDGGCQTTCQTRQSFSNEYCNTRQSRTDTRQGRNSNDCCNPNESCTVIICDEQGLVITGDQRSARVNYPRQAISRDDLYRWSGGGQPYATADANYARQGYYQDLYRWNGQPEAFRPGDPNPMQPGNYRPGETYWNLPGNLRPGEYSTTGSYRPQDAYYNTPGNYRQGETYYVPPGSYRPEYNPGYCQPDTYCNPPANYRPQTNWNYYNQPGYDMRDDGRIARFVLPIVLAAINSGHCNNWNSYNYNNNWHQPRYQNYPGNYYNNPGHHYNDYNNYQPGCNTNYRNYRNYNPGCGQPGAQILQQLPRMIQQMTRRSCY